jgi:hypothetical protein
MYTIDYLHYILKTKLRVLFSSVLLLLLMEVSMVNLVIVAAMMIVSLLKILMISPV